MRSAGDGGDVAGWMRWMKTVSVSSWPTLWKWREVPALCGAPGPGSRACTTGCAQVACAERALRASRLLRAGQLAGSLKDGRYLPSKLPHHPTHWRYLPPKAPGSPADHPRERVAVQLEASTRRFTGRVAASSRLTARCQRRCKDDDRTATLCMKQLARVMTQSCKKKKHMIAQLRGGKNSQSVLGS